MKARRRHDLRENVLAAELGKTVTFFRKWGTYIAWGVLIAALVVVVVVYSRSKSKQRVNQLWAQYDRLVVGQMSSRVSPDDLLLGFKNLSDQDNDRWIAANSCVYAAATYARQIAAAGIASPALLLESPAEEAVKYYQRAIGEFAEFPEVAAKAHFGLGKLAEDRGEPEQAKAEYRAILAMSELEGYPILGQAKEALERVDGLLEPVKMASTAPATAPATPAEAKATGG